jgi:hypothetical protein
MLIALLAESYPKNRSWKREQANIRWREESLVGLVPVYGFFACFYFS